MPPPFPWLSPFGMRATLLLLALFLGSAVADAQIVIVHFKDAKAAKRYKKHTTETASGMVLFGEPIVGGGMVVKDNQVLYRGGNAGGTGREDTSNALFALNADDPADVPYKLQDGEKKLVKKKAKVIVNGLDIERVVFYSRTEDLRSLALEYGFRLGRIEELENARGETERASPAWFAAHRLMLLELKRIESWCRSGGFLGAADDFQKRIKKEDKAGKGDTLKQRREVAVASVAEGEVAPELSEVAEKLQSGLTFSCVQSTHFRFLYPSAAYEQEEIERAVGFAEEVLDGFRTEFVDPYVDDEFEDKIPSGKLLMEFFFCPEEHYERFYIDYYGKTWQDERSLELAAATIGQRFEPKIIRYIKLNANRDLDSTITNFLGKTLARTTSTERRAPRTSLGSSRGWRTTSPSSTAGGTPGPPSIGRRGTTSKALGRRARNSSSTDCGRSSASAPSATVRVSTSSHC